VRTVHYKLFPVEKAILYVKAEIEEVAE